MEQSAGERGNTADVMQDVRDGGSRAPERVVRKRVRVRQMPFVVPLRPQAQHQRSQLTVARPPYLVEEECGEECCEHRRPDDGQESVRAVGHRWLFELE